jgi:fructose/tagatose bisphosphate aldolase
MSSENNLFRYHEFVDRASLVIEMIDNVLAAHPVAADRDLCDDLDELQKAAARLYNSAMYAYSKKGEA